MTIKQEDSDTIQKLLEIMAALRDPQRGCPWDREQTFASIAPYTVEEAYEVADAIEREAYTELADELGDLLFQVVYHARLAEEAQLFDFGAVVASICTKLVRRHPHVFSTAKVRSAAAQSVAWEAHKRAERTNRGHGSLLDDVPLALPALMRGSKLGARAAQVGFDWSTASGVRAKLTEELGELDAALEAQDAGAAERELGDVLLALTSLGRHLQIDAESCLRRANERFASRFRHIERALAARGESWEQQSPETLEALWNEAKVAELAET